MVGKSGGANENNFSFGSWCQTQDTMQTIADCKRHVEHVGGSSLGRPSTHKTLTDGTMTLVIMEKTPMQVSHGAHTSHQ